MKIVPSYWDEERECIPPEKLMEIRTIKMEKHLRYAYQNSPFYRKVFEETGVRPEDINDLEDFRQRVPFLTHLQLIENQAANPPFGDLLAVGLKDIRRIYCSPGPLMLPFSRSDMDEYINTAANGLYICGARRGDIVDITYAYQWDLAGTMLDDGFRRLGCAVIPGGTGMRRTHINIMRHLGITVMFAFPSFAMELAETAREMNIDPRNDLKIRLIIIGGEVYGEKDKKILSEEFGAEIREMYGGAETGFVAAECPEGGGLHCFTDSILEIINPITGQNVAFGEGGEIVITDLTRKAMPVIRYKTGDLSEGLNLEPCPCGRTSPRLRRIIGRTGDIQRVKGVYLIPSKVGEVVKKHENLGRFQIIVDRPRYQDRLTIRIESRHLVEDQSLKKTLIEDLRAVTQLRSEIELVPFGSIPDNAPFFLDNRFPEKMGRK